MMAWACRSRFSKAVKESAAGGEAEASGIEHVDGVDTGGCCCATDGADGGE